MKNSIWVGFKRRDGPVKAEKLAVHNHLQTINHSNVQHYDTEVLHTKIIITITKQRRGQFKVVEDNTNTIDWSVIELGELVALRAEK